MLPRLFLLCLGIWFCLASSGAAEAPFLYRGQLLSDNVPANGLFEMRFGLADSTSPERSLLAVTTNQAVFVSNGSFSVALDFGNTVFDGSPRWLEIGVRTNGSAEWFTVLAPRQPLLAVPYSLHAHSATTASFATNLADGGASLVTVPASSLIGNVPLPSLAGITGQQMNPATDAAYRDPNTNAIKAIVATTPGPGRLTPLEFGAKGDGVADDTAALQAWLDAAQDRNLIAELPPARSFYRISDSLLVRKQGGLTLIGTGGQSHITGGPPYTKSRIHQVTPGKHGLVITNIIGTGTPTDNIHLQGFMLTAETYSPESYGIGFNGGIPDSDVNVIMNVASRNFGVGLFDGSGCNMSVISCSFSYCGDGIQINGPVVNSVLIQSTIMTGNRSNGLHVVSAGNITFDTGDIVTWKTDLAHLITIQSGLVVIRNMNGEQGSPVEAIKVWSPKGNANVLLEAGGVMPVATNSPNTYSLSVSNARSVMISGTQLNALASDGYAVVEYQSPPVTTSLRPMLQKIVVGNAIMSNWLGNHLRTFIPRLDGSSPNLPPMHAGRFHSGILSVFNNPDDTELVFSAHLSRFNNSFTPVQVPLLQYAKDRLSTMTVSNLTVAGQLRIAKGLSSSFVDYPGLLTRYTYQEGILTGMDHERWDAEALAYVDRADLSDPLELAGADFLVKRLKADGLWSIADAIYLFRGGSPDSAAHNLIGTNYPIRWVDLGTANFGSFGITGDGSGYGTSGLNLAAARNFSTNSGSLMVYVGNTGTNAGVYTGAKTASSSALIGRNDGTYGMLNGGSLTTFNSSAVGPWIISRPNGSQTFLLSRTSTNLVTSGILPQPAAPLGILCSMNETAVPQSRSSANLRAVWVGGGLSTGSAAKLIRAVDEYLEILGIEAP